MSLIRDPVIITAVGHQMMTAGGDITYTKATLYGQDISHLTKEQLESLTSIGNPLLTVPVGISDKSDNDSTTTVVLEATFQNSNLKADLPYSAVGFFAKKGNDAERLVVVGVANPGAYLGAGSPDGVATDALDIKVAIAIGDATNVTAVVDPAGSVTPATLNGAINKLDHDISAKIDAKADKTTVEGDLATKANSSDVAASVKSLTDSIATKADAKTVNDAISKIDFTPYAKTADVDSKLQGYTNTVALTKLLDAKANAVDVYSKTELDKKLLALSTDTDGKVNVDQVSSMIADKADKADVTAELAKKDDTSDVDAKIKTVTDLANTKANANDVYNRSTVDNAFTEVRGRLSKLEGTQTLDSPDFNSITASGVYYITNNTPANIKNNPTSPCGVLVVSNGDGHRASQVYYPDDGSAPWCRSLNESNWLPWYQLSTKKDVSNRDNSINNLINQVKQIDGETVISDAVDVNTLVGTPNQITVYKLSNVGNTNAPSWFSDNRGVMIVLNYDGNAKTQIWTPVGTGAPNTDGTFGWRYWEGNNPTAWNRFASVSYVDNLHTDLQNQINANDNGTITTGYDWNTATPTNQSRTLQNAWIVDQEALKGAVDRMNSIDTNVNGRLPLGGGNMTLRSTINWNGGNIDDKTGNLGGLNWAGGTDWAKIYGDQDDNDNLDLAIDLGDDGSNHVSFRKNGSETSAITSDGHFTGTVDWGHVNGRPQGQVDRVNIITPLFRQIQNSNNWNDIFGVGNPNNVLTSLRIDSGGSGVLLNDFAAGIGFGGADTKGVLSVAYQDHQARITGGNGTGPVWSEDIAWKSDVNDLRNQVQQLRENQFEVQTFTDANAAANWEAQKPGKRLAIVNK